MTAQTPFNLVDTSYEVLNGTKALRLLALELTQNFADEPIGELMRDTLIFTLRAMADKAEACACAWIDEAETAAKVEAAA